ncbi:MAG: protein kinase [Lachnospiraceae bacterium]
MSEIINQYELLAPFQNKNAGFSRWTYATRKNKDYFLKEFLDPVYPTDESISLDLRRQRILDCEEYEVKKRSLYEAVNNASDGNMVRIFEFFRFDNHYYIATERIVAQKIPMAVMQAVPFENRLLLCKTIAHEMMNLHKAHVVHADIKENNIIIKQTEEGKLVGKIIDFDASFFEDDPPRDEDELGGDQVYLAPEACQFICGDSVELTCKIDVFALGLLFHQYLTGKMPEFDTDEYDYAFDAVLDDQQLQLAPELSPHLQMMIKGMLECDPEKRLSMDKVYSILEELDPDQTENETETTGREAERKMDKRGEDWFFSAGDL